MFLFIYFSIRETYFTLSRIYYFRFKKHFILIIKLEELKILSVDYFIRDK